MSPEQAAQHPDIDDGRDRCRRTASSATPTTSPSRLQELAERTGADEVMISTMTHGLAERLATLEIVADVWRSDSCGSGEAVGPVVVGG